MDNQFSLGLAKRLDVRQETLLKAARQAGTNKLLVLFPAVQFYQENGFTHTEIFANKTTDNEY